MAGRPQAGRSGPDRRAEEDPRGLVRAAGPRDLATLVAHRRRMWRDIGRGTTAQLDRHDVVYRRWLRREIAARRFVGFLVEVDGRPVASGAVWLAPSPPRPGRFPREEVPYILSMYTAPGYRGRGLASRLVREMIAWARSRHYPRIVLHASDYGRPVYERLGFVPSREMRRDLPALRPRRRRGSARGPGRRTARPPP